MKTIKLPKFNNEEISISTFQNLKSIISKEIIIEENQRSIKLLIFCFKISYIIYILSTLYFLGFMLFIGIEFNDKPENYSGPLTLKQLRHLTNGFIASIFLMIGSIILFFYSKGKKNKLIKNYNQQLQQNNWIKIYQMFYQILDPNSEFHFKGLSTVERAEYDVNISTNTKIIFERKNVSYVFGVSVQINNPNEKILKRDYSAIKYNLVGYAKNNFLTQPFVLKLKDVQNNKSLCPTESLVFDKKFYFTAANTFEATKILTPKVIMSYNDMDFLPSAKITLKPDMLFVNYSLKVKGNRHDLAFAKFKRYSNKTNEMINGIATEIIEDLESVNIALNYLQPLIRNNII